MSNNTLTQYKSEIDNVRKCAKNLGLGDKAIENIFKECFDDISETSKYSKSNTRINFVQKTLRTLRSIILLFSIIGVSVYVLLYIHQPTSSIVLRNVQGLTYPTLRIIRFLSVPMIKIFPSLTDLYDETCLVENPYFYVADMECWPCKNVHSVLDLTGINDANTFKSGSGTPFIIKMNEKPVTFKTLQEMYIKNKEILNTEVTSIKSKNPNITNVEDLFSHSFFFPIETHIVWRINKMVPGRIIRKVFPRPSFIFNRSGQSVEKFILVDGVKAEPYIFPNTECSYIFVMQASGERTIVLRPSTECGQDCRTISVVLKASYVLWYNWWYWRPISLPTENSTVPSISYINSYC